MLYISSPRYWLRLLFIAVLTLSLFATNTPAQSGSGDLLVAIEGDVQGLDPSVADSGESFLVAGQIYDTLTSLPTGNSTPQPDLASSWSVSTDGLTWTFTLQNGITFQDGEPFDSAAVVFNFQRWWDPANPYHTGNFGNFDFIFGYKGSPNTLLSDVKILDASQVQFLLTRKDNLLPWYLAQPSFSIASPAAVIAGNLVQHPVGTGPFRFVEWVPGDHVRLEPNPTYWRQSAYLNTLTFKVIGDPATRLNAVQTNTAQVAYNMSSSQYRAASQDLYVSAFTGYSLNVGYLGINRAHGPLGDLKVRQAIAHAINKAELVKLFYEPMDQAAGQFLPEGLLGFSNGLVDYDYNPTLAKSLLSQTAYSGGFPTTLSYRNVARAYLPRPAPVAKAIQAYLAVLGIQADVQEMESSAFLTRVYSGNADLFLLGWGADYPHPSNFFSIFCDPGSFGPYGPRDDAFCASLTNANNEPDPGLQQGLYENASQSIHDNLPVVPLSHGHTIALARSEVAGLNPAFYGEDYETVFLTSGPNQPVDPGSQSTIQTHGDEAPATTITVPAGAVSQPVTLSYSLVDSTTPPPVDQISLGSPFALTAYQGADPLAQETFSQPVGVTYDLTTYGGYLFDPATLGLYIEMAGSGLSAEGWVESSTTCPTSIPSVLDTYHHTFTAYTCQTGHFALFGVQDRVPLFLPLASR